MYKYHFLSCFHRLFYFQILGLPRILFSVLLLIQQLLIEHSLLCDHPHHTLD